MNDGVKVLIERMKTNPEDFTMSPTISGVKEGKFYWVRKEILRYLSEHPSSAPTPISTPFSHLRLLKQEDLDALVEAFKEMHQQEFTDKVMADLFNDGPPGVTTEAGDKARYANEHQSMYANGYNPHANGYNSHANGYNALSQQQHMGLGQHTGLGQQIDGNGCLTNVRDTTRAPSGGIFANIRNVLNK